MLLWFVAVPREYPLRELGIESLDGMNAYVVNCQVVWSMIK